MDLQEIIFTVNGPGELAGIATPLIKAIRKKAKVIITLFTVPCQFSSGLEVQAAKASGLFDNVFDLKDYSNLLFKKKLPLNYKPAQNGIIFYAGGDSFHALFLGKKFGFRTFAYDEGNLSNKNSFFKIFTRALDGDLMVDAALERQIGYQALPIGNPAVTVGFYPGSRPSHFRLMTPFFSSVAEILHKKYPQINFRWGINKNLQSEFSTLKHFSAPIEQPGEKYDLVVSLTGTNTAINAALGIPLVVLLPLNFPQLIPFMGLFGLITNIPGLGYLLKKIAANLAVKKIKFFAIPNIKAQRLIVPELIGMLKPGQVASEIERLLLDVSARQKMHEELPIYMGQPSAEKITEGIFKAL